MQEKKKKEKTETKQSKLLENNVFELMRVLGESRRVP